MNSEQTDQDPQITDHPFEPIPGWPDECGYETEFLDISWPCGYAEVDHTDPGHDPEDRP